MENMIYLERGKTYFNGWDLNNNRVSFEVGNKRRWNFEKIGSVEINPSCIVLFSLYVLTSLEKAKVTHVWDALERGEPLAFLLC